MSRRWFIHSEASMLRMIVLNRLLTSVRNYRNTCLGNKALCHSPFSSAELKAFLGAPGARSFFSESSTAMDLLH